MSLSATLTSALSGLQVAQHALGVTANNIANANTEGYSRQIVQQEPLVIARRGAGVQAGEIERITDQFLTQEMRRQSSVVGESGVVQQYHDRLQIAFGAPGSERDLANQVGRLGAALESFAADPSTPALAREVIARADDLGRGIGQLADQLQVLRGDADGQIDRTIDLINQDLQALEEVNREIGDLAVIDQSSADLLDRRDRLLVSLAEKIDIGTFQRENGQVAVFTASGATLVDANASVLHYDAPSSVSHDTAFGRIAVFRSNQIDPATGAPTDPTGGIELVSSGLRASLSAELAADATADADQLITSRLDGGRLQGLLEVRDRLLPELDDQLQELADGVRFALDAAHAAGTPWPPQSALAGSRTDLADFAGATRSGAATLAVIDNADGSTLLTIAVDVAGAADETALAAQIDADLGALGSAAIGADGNLEITLADSDHGVAIDAGDSSITVTDAAGRDRDFGFAHYFGLGDLFSLDGPRASDLRVRQDLAADPGLLSRARLDVQTGPLTATLGGAGDNRGAQALAEALESAQSLIARGGLPARQVSLATYAADIIAHSATLAASATQAADRDQAMADAVSARAGAVSGVNLDEEMARMVQLQQAYSVAARVVSVTDELFDELMRTAR